MKMSRWPSKAEENSMEWNECSPQILRCDLARKREPPIRQAIGSIDLKFATPSSKIQTDGGEHGKCVNADPHSPWTTASAYNGSGLTMQICYYKKASPVSVLYTYSTPSRQSTWMWI